MCDIGAGLAGEAALTGRHAEKVENGNVTMYYPVMHPDGVPCGEDVRGGHGCKDESKGGEDVGGGGVLAVIELHTLVGDTPINYAHLSFALQIIGISIMNMMISYEEEIKRRTFEALLSIKQIEPLGIDLLDLVEQITAAALHMIDAEAVYLFIVDDYSREIWWLTTSSYLKSFGMRIPFGKSICGFTASTGQIMNIPDCRLDPMFDATLEQQQSEHITSMICVPIPPPAPFAETRCEHGSRSDTLVPNSEDVHSNLPLRHQGVSEGDILRKKERKDCFDSELKQHDCKDTSCGIGDNERILTRSCSLLSSTEAKLWSMKTRTGRPRNISCGSLRHSSDSSRSHVALTAVLKAVNKRGGESFDQVDEDVLTLLCAELNNLLVPRVVEANLIRRAVLERKANLSAGRYINMEDKLREDTLHTIETSILKEYSVAAARHTNALDLHGVEKHSEVAAVQNSDIHTAMGNAAGVMRRLSARTSSTCSSIVPSHQIRAHSLSPTPTCCSESHGAFMEEVTQLRNWDFDPFKADVGCKCTMIENMFQTLGFKEHMGVDLSVLRLWVQKVRGLYRPNPFHNFNHAFSVAHVTWMVLNEVEMRNSCSALEMIACLMAAFCHDVDHPGNTNVFEVQSESDLALMYSDDAVLERHHIHVTFRMLREEGGAANILRELDRSHYQEVREIVVKGILATDMSKHVSHCSRLRKYVAKYCNSNDFRSWPDRDSGMVRQPMVRERSNNFWFGQRSSIYGLKQFNSANAATPPLVKNRGNVTSSAHSAEKIGKLHKDCVFLFETVIHCADLSGQVMATHLALDWGRRVLQEFNNQAMREESLGLPITFMQESNEIEIMKGQIFFLNSIVQPLWEPFVDLFPQLDHRLQQMHKNVEYYKNAVQSASSVVQKGKFASTTGHTTCTILRTPSQNPNNYTYYP